MPKYVEMSPESTVLLLELLRFHSALLSEYAPIEGQKHTPEIDSALDELLCTGEFDEILITHIDNDSCLHCVYQISRVLDDSITRLLLKA